MAAASQWLQQVLSFKSAVALSAGHFVTLNSDREIIAANASLRPLGVLRDDVTVGDTAAVVIGGCGLVLADGAISIMDVIGSNADAEATALTPSESSTAIVAAIALEAATADQDLILAQIVPATGYALVAYTP